MKYSDDFNSINKYNYCHYSNLLVLYFRSEKPSVKEAYMGHLIELANHVVEQCEKNRAFNDFFLYKLPEETLDQWVNFVAEPLGEINKIQQIMLVS